MRISDWSSDVCSSDFLHHRRRQSVAAAPQARGRPALAAQAALVDRELRPGQDLQAGAALLLQGHAALEAAVGAVRVRHARAPTGPGHAVYGTRPAFHPRCLVLHRNVNYSSRPHTPHAFTLSEVSPGTPRTG